MNETHCNIGDTHCITCGDEALVATVVRVNNLTMMAVVVIGEKTTEIDISLVENVAVGDTLFVHGGVALSEAITG
jgi:hydrogenase maturation factor